MEPFWDKHSDELSNFRAGKQKFRQKKVSDLSRSSANRVADSELTAGLAARARTLTHPLYRRYTCILQISKEVMSLDLPVVGDTYYNIHTYIFVHAELELHVELELEIPSCHEFLDLLLLHVHVLLLFFKQQQ